jgi:hypothetical protein
LDRGPLAVLVRPLPHTITHVGIAVHTGIIDTLVRTATMSHRDGPEDSSGNNSALASCLTSADAAGALNLLVGAF